jgi:hypothetical protein
MAFIAKYAGCLTEYSGANSHQATGSYGKIRVKAVVYHFLIKLVILAEDENNYLFQADREKTSNNALADHYYFFN